MKRFLGFSLAMFFALIALALVGGDSGAVAGHGCHGGRRCHGGMMARKHERREERCHGLFGKHRRGHGEAEDCGGCGEVASDCGGCGEAVSGGCAGGDCGGEGVIMSEGVPTEVAPVEAPAAPAAPAAPKST